MSTLSTNASRGEILTDIISDGELGNKYDPERLEEILRKYLPKEDPSYSQKWIEKADEIYKAIEEGHSKDEILARFIEDSGSSSGFSQSEGSVGQVSLPTRSEGEIDELAVAGPRGKLDLF